MVTLASWGEVDGQEPLFALGYAPAPVEPEPSAALVPAMSDEAARWIRTHVWTEWHRKYGGGPRDWHRCRCQWGPSGDCERGEHRHCTEVRGGGALTGPDTHVTISGRKRLFVAVWLADRTCSWTCPCGCGHQPRTASPNAAVRRQVITAIQSRGVAEHHLPHQRR